MLILHRANNPSSKDFIECLEGGVGFEIDIRYHCGKLIVAHDLVENSAKHIYLEDILQIYSEYNCNNIIALNIKSCGLQKILKDLLEQYDIKNYFVFDMAVPDILGYIKEDIKFFTRQSEVEISPSFYKESKGVWLDEFYGHWIDEKVIMEHVSNGKKVAIVSPELHGRDYKGIWQKYKKIIKDNKLNDNNLMICTDFPHEFSNNPKNNIIND
ncbi:hypothetical protein N9O56_00050 [Rickettsiales bacterium]|nr:hypothetical protein [Rickettsiales bacterium]